MGDPIPYHGNRYYLYHNWDYIQSHWIEIPLTNRNCFLKKEEKRKEKNNNLNARAFLFSKNETKEVIQYTFSYITYKIRDFLIHTVY